jgi:integrase
VTLRKKLTNRTLQSLKPEPALYYVWDSTTPAFGVRVMPSGRITFVLAAHLPGKAGTRRALGEYGVITLEEARDKASEWRKAIKQGIDPARAEERQREATLRQQATTFGAVAEDFIKFKLSRERTGRTTELDIRREFLPRWGKRAIADITPRDVRDVVKAVAERAPYQAHNVLGHAKRLFSWAIDQHVYGLEVSPCDRLKGKAIVGEAREPRDRVLTDDELRAFWKAAAATEYPYGPALRMLLLTGQRHGEVVNARRGEFDLGRKLWTIPKERFKSDKPHMVPLSADVIALLESLPSFAGGDHLFSTTFGRRPTWIGNKAKDRLDGLMLKELKDSAERRCEDPKLIKLEAWKLHDLRRTVRSHLAALRVPDLHAEQVLGHAKRGMQRVYDQHRYLDEMREALDRWAARLRGIVSPPPDNVRPLRAANE